MNPEKTLVRKQVLEGYSFPAKILAYLVLCENIRSKLNKQASKENPNELDILKKLSQEYSAEEVIKAHISCLKYSR